MKAQSSSAVFVLVTSLAASAAAQTCNPGWSSLFGGVTAPAPTLVRVAALEVHDDGAGPDLYVGGDFRSAGGVTANRIARWSGSDWSGLSGPTANGMNGAVFALESFDGALYAGGLFTRAGGVDCNNVAMWDGIQWKPLVGVRGTGVGGQVVALAAFDDGSGEALYVAGNFTTAGGSSGGVLVNRIVKWDGSDWFPLEAPGGIGASGPVAALAVFDDGSGPALYAGGNFTHAGGHTVNRIARWDGADFTPLAGPSGTGVNSGIFGGVLAMVVFNDGQGSALYAAGGFGQAGGIDVNHIARWDGMEWSPLPGVGGVGTNSPVVSLATVNVEGLGTALYAGGVFDEAGGVLVNKIARWDGRQWLPLEGPRGTGVTSSDSVASIGGFNDGKGRALYAGGNFREVGGVEAGRIARWWCDSCYADCSDATGPGVLDIFDFVCFQDAFVGGDPYADCNGDVELDIFDFVCFQDAFTTGCP